MKKYSKFSWYNIFLFLFTFYYTPTRVTGHSKTLIDNIFYNKPTLNITATNITSIISDHLIQFLIESSATNTKLEQTCKLQRCYKNFDQTKFKNDQHKISWKEPCSNRFKCGPKIFSANNRQTSRQTCSICNVKVSLFFHNQTLDNHGNSKLH